MFGRMARPVLVAHSSGPQGPGEGSEPLVSRLRAELGDGYEVQFPILPDPDDPHFEPWAERLRELLAEAADSTIVVGHSLGSSVVLQFLAEGDQLPVAGMVLLATPMWGNGEWEREWALPEGWPPADAQHPSITFFHSRDDEEISVDHLERYRARFPDAEFRALDGCGHLYDRGDLTEVVEEIQSL
jgi:predicted alpha/beta hydrolase family esterase